MATPVSGYITHQPILMACLATARGPVVECGSGSYSTPILRSFCAVKGLPFRSLDEDPAWVDAMNTAYGGWVTVEYCKDIAAELKAMVQPDLLFIDHGAFKISPLYARTWALAVARDRNVRLSVVHDSEPWNRWKYKYDESFGWFKHVVHFDADCYRLDRKYPRYPWATALSNVDHLQWLQAVLPQPNESMDR